MNFLSGLHGVVAIVLLCSLLFLEEAGVPLPFAPGELTLLAGGLLIAAGGLDAWVFYPLAFAVCVVGAMVGYSWARVVGEHSLTGLAVRFHQAKALRRVSGRVKSAGPVGVGVTRLIPGLRIYTTLVAGAFEVKRRTFLEGLVPSTAIWVAVYVSLGVVAGIPVEHFLTQLARLAVQGAILLVIGVGGYFVIRHAPERAEAPLVNMPPWVKTVLAALVDLGVVASVLTGILALIRRVTGTGVTASWADGLVVLAALTALYLFVTRRGTGATLGEALLHTTYLPRRAVATVDLGVTSAEIVDPQLESAAHLLRAAGPIPRLAVLRTLLKAPSTSGEVAIALRMAPNESSYHLAALGQAGLVAVDPGSQEGQRFHIADHARGWITDLLADEAAADSQAAADTNSASPPTSPSEVDASS